MKINSRKAFGHLATEFPIDETWTDSKGHTRQLKPSGHYETVRQKSETAREAAKLDHAAWVVKHKKRLGLIK